MAVEKKSIPIAGVVSADGGIVVANCPSLGGHIHEFKRSQVSSALCIGHIPKRAVEDAVLACEGGVYSVACVAKGVGAFTLISGAVEHRAIGGVVAVRGPIGGLQCAEIGHE